MRTPRPGSNLRRRALDHDAGWKLDVSRRNAAALQLAVILARRPLGEVDVVVVERLAVDAVAGWRDPGGNLPALVDRLHEGPHVCLVHVGRQPLAAPGLPLAGAELLAVW